MSATSSGHLNGRCTFHMLAGFLLQIIEKAVRAYQEHTGEAIDPSLIRPEAPV
jgi:hypothetical protein